MDSTASIPGRGRGESFVSAASDGMDVVQDENEGQKREKTDRVDHQQEHEPKFSHIKLRGRGGFSHPQGAGRGRGTQDQAAPGSIPSKTDPMDKLTSSMSALQFVPHSVRMAQGRGRGRGG
jgi:hypothetical protein